MSDKDIFALELSLSRIVRRLEESEAEAEKYRQMVENLRDPMWHDYMMFCETMPTMPRIYEVLMEPEKYEEWKEEHGKK